MASESRFADTLSPRVCSNLTAGSRSKSGRLAELLLELRGVAAELEVGAQSLVNLPLPVTAGVRLAAAAPGHRHIIYVHGICRHDPGFSDDWWNALHPFTPAFGAGDRDGTRQEVLWSDLVNESNAAAVPTRRAGGCRGRVVRARAWCARGAQRQSGPGSRTQRTSP